MTNTDANGCESVKASSVTLEYVNLPSTPIVNNESACFGTVIPDLTNWDRIFHGILMFLYPH